MLPTSIGALLLLFALVPGWVHLQLMGRSRLRAGISALEEVLELLAVGLLTTGVPLLLLTLLPHHAWSPLVDITAWVRGGSVYFAQHLRRVAGSAVALLAFSCVLAWVLYRIRSRGRRDEYVRSSGVWAQALGVRPPGTVPYVGIMLKDGRELEGLLDSFSLSETATNERDIALRSPLRVKGKGAQETSPLLGVDRLVVNASDIHILTISLVSEQRS